MGNLFHILKTIIKENPGAVPGFMAYFHITRNSIGDVASIITIKI